jgi:GTP-binding protein HflX
VLLGYTNAGKTSLMNALSQTKLSARSRPFETLDTTSRCLTRHGTEVLLSDTVGFIRRLPERLLASFESTLAEVQEASLLVLVVDVSDREYPLHLRTTHEVLGRLEAIDVPRFYVFNKCDRVETLPSEADLLELTEGQPYMAVSAHDAARVAQLRQALLDGARQHLAREEVFVPYTASETLQRVYAECRVIAAEAEPLGMRFTLEGEPHVVSRLRRQAEQVSV